MQGAVNFALMMSQMEGGCPVDYNTITDLFLQVNWLLSDDKMLVYYYTDTVHSNIFSVKGIKLGALQGLFTIFCCVQHIHDEILSFFFFFIRGT